MQIMQNHAKSCSIPKVPGCHCLDSTHRRTPLPAPHQSRIVHANASQPNPGNDGEQSSGSERPPVSTSDVPVPDIGFEGGDAAKYVIFGIHESQQYHLCTQTIPFVAHRNLQLPKEVIEQLRFSVFGFDSFFVTGVENYVCVGGVFFIACCDLLCHYCATNVNYSCITYIKCTTVSPMFYHHRCIANMKPPLLPI